MAITQEEILQLTVSMFNASLGANYLADIESANFATTAELAAYYGTLSQFTSQFDGMTDAEQVTAMLSNFGLDSTNTAAFDYFTAQVAAGVSNAVTLQAADAYLATQTAEVLATYNLTDAAATLVNKTAAATYYSVTTAQSAATVADLKATVSTITEDATTVATANAAVDTAVASTTTAAALATLADANAEVTAQNALIAELLVDSFSNEFVEDNAVENANTPVNVTVGTLEASDVIEADIAEAHAATADVLVGADATGATGNADILNTIVELAADFNALTDAQQDLRIATAIGDLEADITTKETAVATAAEDLESGVANLVATASTKADALVTAMDTQDAQDTLTANAITAAVAIEGTASTTIAMNGTPVVGVLEIAIAGVNDTAITAISAAGVVSYTDAVVLDTETGIYTITDSNSDTTTITQSYLDAVLTATQGDVDALASVTAAQNTLASAVISVLEAQDSTFLDTAAVTFDTLDTDTAFTVVETVGSVSVAIDYSAAKDGTGTPKVAVDGADVDTYAGALSDLTDAEEALVTFNDAVTDWQGTETLVDALAALNETLGTVGDASTETSLYAAVTAATEAITTATDDEDAPGLGLTLVELDGTTQASAVEDSEIFLLGETNDTITGFEADYDSIFVGTDYTLTAIADEDAVIADNLGGVTTLDAIVLDNGTDTVIYFEEETFAGNGSTAADTVSVTLSGVTDATVSIDANGFMSIA